MIRTRSIQKVLSVAICSLIAVPVFAGRDDDADRVSKNGRVSAMAGGVEITVEYGRPNVKNREIWGSLVPYGKVWRTGANEATTITLDKDALIQGELLAAGTYALFTIPEKDRWTFVFNGVPDQWGAFNHDVSQDVLRVTATPRTAEMVESLEFRIADSAVTMHWEKLAVSIEVSAAK